MKYQWCHFRLELQAKPGTGVEHCSPCLKGKKVKTIQVQIDFAQEVIGIPVIDPIRKNLQIKPGFYIELLFQKDIRFFQPRVESDAPASDTAKPGYGNTLAAKYGLLLLCDPADIAIKRS